MKILKTMGLTALALAAFMWFLLPLAMAPMERDGVEFAEDEPARPARAAPAPGGEVQPAVEGRAAVPLGNGELRIRLVSASVPISRLSIALEQGIAAEPRILAIHDVATLRNVAPGSCRLSSNEPAWLAQPSSFELGASARAVEVELAIEPLGPWTGRVLDLDTGLGLGRARFVWSVRGELGGLSFEGEQGRREIELDEGRFSIGCGGFLGRSSQVRIEADGFAPFITPWIDYDGRVGIELGDIGLESMSSRTLALGGQVVDETTGEGLCHVRVTPVPLGTRLEDLWVHHGTLQGVQAVGERVASSDEQGRFELGLREPERVQLAAFSTSHGLTLSEPVGCVPGITIRMSRRAALRGRVVTTEEVLASGMLTGVLVTGAESTCVLGLDANQTFELGGLAAGRFRVALQALEPQSAGQLVCAEVAVESVDVREGEISELELRYRVDPVVSALRGRVLLPPDVEFSTMRAALWPDGESAPSQFAVIDLDGRFEFLDPPPSKARLFVGGSSADSSRGFVATRVLDRASSPADSVEFDVRLPLLAGRAWNAGAPAARVSIVLTVLASELGWARAVAEGLSIATDAEGGFGIYGLRPGDYEIGRLGGRRQAIRVGDRSIALTELRLD